MTDMTRRERSAASAIDDDIPAIPRKVRDIAYIGGLIVAATTQLAVITIGVLHPAAAEGATIIGNGVLSAAGIIVSGLGVIYRPGKLGVK